MMNTHTTQHVALRPGRAIPLGRGGDLEVAQGVVWLTRRGDPNDHVLAAGQRFRLGSFEDAVIESWQASGAASVRWQPRHQDLAERLLAVGFAGMAALAGAAAAGLRAAAGRFASLARSAASSASRAQGCIQVGDSSASSGALK